jgi:phosphoribosyl 1,2-cyclic phosphate phosphodiesterase
MAVRADPVSEVEYVRITFLGTGTSHGVPMIDCMLNGYARCEHETCRKALSDPRYRRSRASILVEQGGFNLLIDTSQDFREQMLANQVMRVDAVLFTHAHADHIYGLPDIRSYSAQQKTAIDLYGSADTLVALREAFHYIFEPPAFVGGGIPSIAAHELAAPSVVGPLEVAPIHVVHGPLNGCQGYRLGPRPGGVAYIPDVKVIPESSLDALQGLDVLILNCLRPRPHSSHLSLVEAVAYAERIAPARCLFTHMTHDIDPAVHGPQLPPWASFAYDGLTVEA